MLKNFWRVCRWGALASALLCWGCAETETLHCVAGESAGCVGVADCAGVKVCDTNGLVFGSCMCPVPLSEQGPRSSNSVTRGCAPGDSRACRGADECEGIATCGDTGTFGTCQCSAPVLRVPSLRPNVLGAACRSSAQCGSSLICWAEYENGPGATGGPAAGYCTASCRASADCTLFEQPGDCWLAAGATLGVCLARCSDPASSTACAGRTEVACATYAALALAGQAAEQGLCAPQCHSDAECGERRCDTGGASAGSGPVATCVGGPDAGVVGAGP
jgi:hypothetical protein